MAAGTDYPPPLSMLDGSYRKENVTVVKEEKSESFEIIKQPSIGKPPRHISAIRHSVSSVQLAPATEVVILYSKILPVYTLFSILNFF